MLNWDDLRYFLALYQEGQLKVAARKLRADPTTVSRRLAALEEAAGEKLMIRSREGWHLTEAGRRIIAPVQAANAAIEGVKQKLRQSDEKLSGRVRITTFDVIASGWIAPLLPELHALYPQIRVEIDCTPLKLDLQRGQADIAFRMGRPTENDLVIRKMGQVSQRAFASVHYFQRMGITPESITDLENRELLIPFGHVPWLDHLDSPRVVFRSSSPSTLISACAAGLGITLIPDVVAAEEERLVLLKNLPLESITPIWMVMHQDVVKVRTVRAVADFLVDRIVPRRHMPCI